ncbi:hypothetical protein CLV40_11347 [Actinokineospora auranticolor]|uniref:Lumazine-binding protein n=2 Tax=Actinokineospora auranticolor TaxID=155976 RepID=A0A2S6GK32_9PSEU|nr:hypothetical protein CLV40_11347 [Actinokineospora auranticolor]
MWLLSGAVVVVLAAVVTLVLVLTRAPDTSTPKGAAEAIVEAFGDKDKQALAAVSCPGAAHPLELPAPSPMVGADLGDVRLASPDEAVADVTIRFTDSSRQTQMGLARENDRWCLTWFGP